jgi:hypothetical protein
MLMEREYHEDSEVLVRPPAQPQGQNQAYNARYNKPPAGNAHRYGGIHLRRDKRYPLANRGAPPMPQPEAAPKPAPLSADPLTQWKEAVMLWLSWHSTQEKLTAKMCKPGQDQNKIEALLDEADKLRKRAIELSEDLIRRSA